MGVELQWIEQMEDMDEEDRYHEFVMSKKLYPSGLFNLTSNPLFFLRSRSGRISAIRDVLTTEREIKSKSIFYDKANEVVFFETVHNLRHRCDIRSKQIKIKSFYI